MYTVNNFFEIRKAVDLSKMNYFLTAILVRNDNGSEDIDTFHRMVDKYRELQNKKNDPTYIPTYRELENGGVQVMYERQELAVANKLLYLSKIGREITGSRKGFISWNLRRSVNGELLSYIPEAALRELAQIYLATLDGDELRDMGL